MFLGGKSYSLSFRNMMIRRRIDLKGQRIFYDKSQCICFCKGLFIWRRVVPSRRVTLRTEPPQAIELFIHFFIKSSEPFTRESAKLARGGRVTLGGGSLALKEA